MLFNKVAILGIGLIGSSLARNIKENKDANFIAIYDKNKKNLETASSLNLGDIYTSDLSQAVTDADIIIFATPVCSFGELAYQTSLYAKKKAIITDVGSVKQYALKEIEKQFGRA